MDAATYRLEARVERNHWWFRGRRRILSRFLAELSPPLPDGARVLDVGCGTGANGPVLAEGGRFAVGLDVSLVPFALEGTGDRGHAVRLRGDAASLPFADESFDLVVALDVLEHLRDDRVAARELRRVLKPTGAIVVFVPAFRALWGFQDKVSHHQRRYTRAEIADTLTGADLHIERLTFFNMFLFLPIFGARVAMRLRPPRHIRSENEIGGPVTNAILDRIFALEAPLLERLDLPIGVSLACVARR